MPTLITLIEPAGLSLAPELTIALARRRRRETRRRLVVVDLDTTGRLAERVRAEGPEGIRLSAIEPTVSDGLLALSNEPYLTETPGRLRTATGEYVRGGTGLEIAWRRVESAALATGLALPVVDRLRSMLTDEAEGRETIAFAPPGMGALAASVVAASDAVVMVVPASGSPTEVKQAQTWLNQVATARGAQQVRLLARVATVHPDQASKAPSGALTSAAGQPSTAPVSPRRGLWVSVRMPSPFDPPSALSGFGNVTPWFMLRELDGVLVTAAQVWRALTEAGI